jgi:hypothetical protein
LSDSHETGRARFTALHWSREESITYAEPVASENRCGSPLERVAGYVIQLAATRARQALVRQALHSSAELSWHPDPVASGIVPRIDHPGGNITGFANFEASLAGKWLELLSEIAPGLKRAAIMFNPDSSTASVYMPSLETAARSLKVEPIIAPVHSDVEIETAIIALWREPGSGLVVMHRNPRMKTHVPRGPRYHRAALVD